MAAIKKIYSCVKCGACTDKCHYYLGTKDPNNMPVGRQNLMRGSATYTGAAGVAANGSNIAAVCEAVSYTHLTLPTKA